MVIRSSFRSSQPPSLPPPLTLSKITVDHPDPTHLVVLSHGIAANEGCMTYIQNQLLSHYGASDLLVLNSCANASLGSTKDGINIGGHR